MPQSASLPFSRLWPMRFALHLVVLMLLWVTPMTNSRYAHAATDKHTVILQVSIPNAISYTKVKAEIIRLGNQSSITLVDDGSIGNDRPGDGIYLGQQTGLFARYIHLRLLGEQEDVDDALLFSGVVRTDDHHLAKLDFQVVKSVDGAIAFRSAASDPGQAYGPVRGIPMIVAYGWGLFMLMYVGWLVFFRFRQSQQ